MILRIGAPTKIGTLLEDVALFHRVFVDSWQAFSSRSFSGGSDYPRFQIGLSDFVDRARFDLYGLAVGGSHLDRQPVDHGARSGLD